MSSSSHQNRSFVQSEQQLQCLEQHLERRVPVRCTIVCACTRGNACVCTHVSACVCREEAAAACDCIYPPFRKKKKVTTAPHPPILFFKINKEKRKEHEEVSQCTQAGHTCWKGNGGGRQGKEEPDEAQWASTRERGLQQECNLRQAFWQRWRRSHVVKPNPIMLEDGIERS